MQFLNIRKARENLDMIILLDSIQGETIADLFRWAWSSHCNWVGSKESKHITEQQSESCWSEIWLNCLLILRGSATIFFFYMSHLLWKLWQYQTFICILNNSFVESLRLGFWPLPCLEDKCCLLTFGSCKTRLTHVMWFQGVKLSIIL